MAIGTSKLSRKGQITIPKSVRESLGLKPGDDLIIASIDNEDNGTVIIRKPNLEDYVKEAEAAYKEGNTVSHEELFSE
ncbi:AbrB/MazE/SpoVT family DNA-binding domain-containing protein [Candidatus Bipolaricaulota bacterium]|nr:AbrB/MazE/SpoVT family DNA-binding domain-containing protein [Candidatus Bipolaricaulota bacterium]